MADGSIVISTKLDNKKAEKELDRLIKKIESMEAKLSAKESERNQIAEQLKAANEEAIEAYKNVERLQSALKASQAVTSVSGPSTNPLLYMQELENQRHIKEELLQQEKVLKQKETAAERLVANDAKAVRELERQTAELNKQKAAAGKLADQIKHTNALSGALSDTMSGVTKRIGKLGKRMAGLAKRVFVFSAISSALRGMTSWMGKVIKANDEAASAIAQLKGALLTLAQPIVEVIIPAFTKLVNIITRVVSVAARLVSSLFGKNIETTKASAEALYEEIEALDGVGSAAKKAAGSLASFDEINQLSSESSSTGGSSSSKISADFSAVGDFDTAEYKKKIDEITTYISGALLALGALLTFSGANIPLGLGLMAAGAVGLAAEIKENWGATDGKVKAAINRTLLIVGASLLALGAILAFSGANIPLGIGLMLVGAASLGTAAALNWGSLSDEVKNTITKILIVVGESLIALGAILAFSGVNVPLGIGMIAAGAVAYGAAAALDWDYVSGNIKSIVTELLLILGSALLVLGAVLTFSGANIPLGIGLMIAGAASLATAAALNWDAVKTALQGSIGKITAIVSAALLVLGVILCLTGVAIPLGVALIAAGAAGLVTVGAINWDAMLDKIKEAWGKIKNWFNTSVKPKLTLSYWKEQFKNIGEGLKQKIKDGINAAITLFNRFIGWVNDKMNISWSAKYILGKEVIPAGSLQLLNIPKIPMLAEGAVIPPNREFLAVLGDQKSGTNIETPLSTMVDAFKQAWAEVGGGTNGTITVVVNLDGREVARNQIKHINDMTRERGKPVILV